MIRLTLATLGGEQIAPVYAGPRYVCCGGDLRDQAQQGARPTLTEAQLAFRGYERMLSEPQDQHVRALLAREADELFDAITECCRQRRAAGWSRPEDADISQGARA